MSGAATLQETVSAIVPCIHMAWPEDAAPALPFAVWYLERERGFHADGGKFARASAWCVELYERTCDYELHDELEDAIEAAFGPCEKTETWLSDEGAVATVYRFKEIG